MAFKLKDGVLLSVGMGHQPVDLVDAATGERLPLSAEEAAVAMLLKDGVEGLDDLRQLGRRHQVDWDDSTMQQLLDQLERAKFTVEYVSDLPVLPDSVLQEEEEDERTHFDPRFHSGDVTEEELLDAASGVDLDGLFAEQLPPRPLAAPAAPPPRLSPRPRPATNAHPMVTGEIAMRPLAMVAVLVRDGKIDAARELVRVVLDETPGDLQAQAMLEMIEALSKAAAPTGRPTFKIAIGALLFLLVGASVALALIQVPRHRRVPCTFGPSTASPIKTTLSGVVADVGTRVGGVIEQGQTIVRVTNVVAARKTDELKAMAPVLERLLRVMRTGGANADEEWARDELSRAEEGLGRLKDCKEARCDARVRLLRWRKAQAKSVSRFCEWQALPAEVKQTDASLRAVRRELEELQREPTDVRIKSPARGLVRKIVSEGDVTQAGQDVAEIVDADHFLVSARVAEARVKQRGDAIVQIAGQGVTETYKGQLGERGANGAVQLRIRADVSKVRFSGSCELIMRAGKISLARHLLAGAR